MVAHSLPQAVNLLFLCADMGYAYGYLLSKEISDSYHSLLESVLGGRDEVLV